MQGLTGLMLGASALAADTLPKPLPKLSVEQPWARATAPGMVMGAVYLRIRNPGPQPDALLGASNPELAEAIELHRHSHEQGVMRMRQVARIDVPAKGVARLEPGGDHLMLINLKKPLQAGSRISLALKFEKGGTLQIQVPVQTLDAEGPGKGP